MNRFYFSNVGENYLMEMIFVRNIFEIINKFIKSNELIFRVYSERLVFSYSMNICIFGENLRVVWGTLCIKVELLNSNEPIELYHIVYLFILLS